MTFSKNEDTSDLVGFLLVVVVGLVLFVGWFCWLVGWIINNTCLFIRKGYNYS